MVSDSSPNPTSCCPSSDLAAHSHNALAAEVVISGRTAHGGGYAIVV